MNNITANISFLTFDRMLSAFYLFVLMLLLAANYKPEVYGYYQYAFALGFVVTLALQFADEKVIKNIYVQGRCVFNNNFDFDIKSFFGINSRF